MKIGNIFDTASLRTGDEEHFEQLCAGEHARIERIVSRGHTTPDGQWYEQEKTEWVILLSGEARLAFPEGKDISLKAGDYVLLPAGMKHRVSYTSKDPECIWIGVHFK